jgi:hypothetical protein
VEFGDKRVVIDPLKAFFDVGIQDVFVLLVNAGMKGFNRLVTRASGPEAVAGGLELRLPLRVQGEFRQGLAGAIRPDGNSYRSFLRRARLGNPDPAYGLNFRRQGQGLGEAEPLGWGEGCDPLTCIKVMS